MARSIRFTKAERDVLCSVLTEWADATAMVKMAKTARAVVAKVRESEEQQVGVDVAPIEEALIASARGKVLALEGGYGRASAQARSVQATAEQAALIGAYLARNNFYTGPFTLLDVLNKWYQWLPKARATAPPPALGPGLAADASDVGSPASAGKAPAGRRSAPGFR